MEEEWRTIKDYSNYQVSNLGNLKSLNYHQTGNEKLLKPHKVSGHLQVPLSKNGKIKMFFVHRLVAQTFIPNPNNYPIINHKDENPLNNCVDNLEWCTHKYNSNYGTCKERISKSNTNNPKRSTKIKCLDLKTNEVTYYPSISEFARFINVGPSSLWSNIYKWKSAYKNRYIIEEIGEN